MVLHLDLWPWLMETSYGLLRAVHFLHQVLYLDLMPWFMMELFIMLWRLTYLKRVDGFALGSSGAGGAFYNGALKPFSNWALAPNFLI